MWPRSRATHGRSSTPVTRSSALTPSTCFRTRRMSKPSSCSRSLRRRFEESFEQRAELAGAEEILRVPLDAEAEARRRILDRFDDAVGRGRRRDEPFCDVLHRLVMPAVDLERFVD